MRPEEELEDCVHSEYARLVGVVTVVTGSPQLAEEAVQEAFARAWERMRRGKTVDHLAAWVVTVALNHARSGRRRAAAELRALERSQAVAATAEQPTEHDAELAVRAAIADLPQRQREAVVLYYLLDLEVAVVSRLLRASEGTVKSALSRARKKLTVLLADQETEV